jgi:hypothetical protein
MRVAARCLRQCKVQLYKSRISVQKWKLHPTHRTLCHTAQQYFRAKRHCVGNRISSNCSPLRSLSDFQRSVVASSNQFGVCGDAITASWKRKHGLIFLKCNIYVAINRCVNDQKVSSFLAKWHTQKDMYSTKDVACYSETSLRTYILYYVKAHKSVCWSFVTRCHKALLMKYAASVVLL